MEDIGGCGCQVFLHLVKDKRFGKNLASFSVPGTRVGDDGKKRYR